jgi:starch synthase
MRVRFACRRGTENGQPSYITDDVQLLRTAGGPPDVDDVSLEVWCTEMKVLSVTSEIYPYIKTGGLADVTGSLPKALKSFGVDSITLVPGYPVFFPMARASAPLYEFDDLLGERAAIRFLQTADLMLFILDMPSLFERPGSPYLDENGIDHHDNWKRFAALSLAAALIANGELPGWTPDIVHTHDWQSALTSVYMREMGCEKPVVLTIHNIAFQGQFPTSLLPYLHLPPSTNNVGCMEYYGDISFLKGGLMTSDVITTVSPTYAREILTPRFGMGMEGVLKLRRDSLKGILNGIDDDVWNPETDSYLPQAYDLANVELKRHNRRKLLKRMELHDDAGPIFAAISRLTWQKGMDMLAYAADYLVFSGGKLIICGKGDPDIERMLLSAAEKHPGRIAVNIGYSEELAHLIHGGSDAIIQPSRFEPCGLTQLYGLRYGSIPVVSRTGGLAETVIDANDAAMNAQVATGFQFHPVTTDGLCHAIRRAIDVYNNPKQWQQLQTHGMKARFSWERSAGQYAALFRSLIRKSGVSSVEMQRAAG